MSEIAHLDARVDAMQKELIGQISGLAARCAMLQSELAASNAELKSVTEARDKLQAELDQGKVSKESV